MVSISSDGVASASSSPRTLVIVPAATDPPALNTNGDPTTTVVSPVATTTAPTAMMANAIVSPAALDEEDPYYVGIQIQSNHNGMETKPGEAASPGEFVLERSGNRSDNNETPLTVNHRVGGTATSGSDYEALQGSVTFPSGADTVKIPVNVIDDFLIEGTETVTITILDGAGYNPRGDITSTVSIADNDYPEIVIQTFIPDPKVSVPLYGTFLGDDRRYFDTTPEVADNDYRTRIDVLIPSNFFQDPIKTEDAGPTRHVGSDGVVDSTNEATVANGKLVQQLGSTYDCTTQTLHLRVTNQSQNPSTPVGPSINYVFNFDIKENLITFVGGYHDTFPGYEVFIKDKSKTELNLVYGFISANSMFAPGGLMGTGEAVQVNGPYVEDRWHQ